MKIKNLSCAACKNIMVDKGKIPEGKLFVCKNCNSKRIYIEDINRLQDVDSYGNAYREKFDQVKVLSQMKLFYDNLSGKEKEKDILDIGCGNGEFIKALIQNGYSASGLECDSILIEHINNVENAMIQLRSLVKKGGKLFILTPDSDSIFDLLAMVERKLTLNKSQRLMSICLNRYHLHRFSTKGLRVLLERFGFVVDQVQRVQVFSLKKDVYMNGFAPGIKRWTNNTAINLFLSSAAMSLIKTFNITNKIFLTAIKT
ncbi:MAG: class I SAM-dependent methyltransferase [Ignavibacteriaceae bacterium]|nr:class I SAM-dependent methyltransferase [Ignavibacteriaceae bacterium]